MLLLLQTYTNEWTVMNQILILLKSVIAFLIIATSSQAFGSDGLCRASINGDIEEVARIIESGIDVNFCEEGWGRSPLGFARNKEILELLLKNGANPSISHDIPLLTNMSMSNCERGTSNCLENFKTLISHGADVLAVDQKNRNALFLAASTGHYDIVKYIIEGEFSDKFDLNEFRLIDRNNVNLLGFMMTTGHPDLFSKDFVKYLKTAGLDFDLVNKTRMDSALSYASYLVLDDFVEYLIELGVDLNKTNITNDSALTTALLKYERVNPFAYEIAENLINAGAKLNTVNNAGYTPVLLAAKHGADDLLRLMFERGADASFLNSSRYPPLFEALDSTHLDGSTIIDLLIDNGADVNSQAGKLRIPVISSALEHRKDFDLIEKLISTGANVNIVDAEGNSPLWYVIRNYNHDYELKLVKLLLESGANPNLFDKTPLLLMYNLQSEVFKLLLEYGANPHYQNSDGENLLMLSVCNKSVNALKVLISKGVDINGLNNKKQNALFYLSECSQYSYIWDMYDFLVSQGANYKRVNVQGHDVLTHYMVKKVDPRLVSRAIDTYKEIENTINRIDKNGGTYLTYALCSPNRKYINKILKLNPNLSLRNAAGYDSVEILISVMKWIHSTRVEDWLPIWKDMKGRYPFDLPRYWRYFKPHEDRPIDDSTFEKICNKYR